MAIEIEYKTYAAMNLLFRLKYMKPCVVSDKY